MNKFTRSLVIGLILSLLPTTALFATGDREDDGKLIILATTNMVADVASNIAGDLQDIEVLIAFGDDPHNYEPTPRDMAKIEQADLILTNGFGLEETLLETLENVTAGNVVEVSSAVVPLEFESEDEHHEDEDDHNHDKDPHTWTSPLSIMAWTDVISETLIDLDPANGEAYVRNAEAYRSQLKDLDEMARSAFSAIKEKDRKLVSDHSIFGYFSRDYGFESFGAIIPNFSSQGEASAGDLTELIEEVNEHQIRAVFIGNTAGNALLKLGKVLVDEADHPVQLLTIMTGSLAAPGEEGDTYLEYFQFNVNQFVKGLASGN